jgi:hypothetical protein
VAALLVPAMLLTAPMVQAQKKKDKDKDKDKDTTSEKMIRAGILLGKVAAIYEDKRKIRLQVTVSLPKLNTGALYNIQSAQRQLIQARLSGNLVGMIQAQQSLARAQATLYTLEQKTQDVELEALDDVVVRTLRPRDEFDEKGKPKKFTKAELKEMKGPDPKVPGYKAEFGDVSSDQIIQVTLVKKKATGPAPKVVGRKGKVKDGDADAALDLLGDNMPQISMIMIVMEPPPSK